MKALGKKALEEQAARVSSRAIPITVVAFSVQELETRMQEAESLGWVRLGTVQSRTVLDGTLYWYEVQEPGW